MTTRIWQVAMAAVLVWMPSAMGAEADKLAELEKKIAAGWAKHTSMTAKIKTVAKMTMPTGHTTETTSEGTYEAAKKTGKDKGKPIILFRMDVKNRSVMTMGGQKTVTNQTMTTIMDGTHTYMLMDNMGQKTVMKQKQTKKDSNDPTAMLKTLRRTHEVRVRPDEKLAGTRVYVVQATPKKKTATAPTMMQPSKMVFYHRHNDGTLLKNVVCGPDGKPISTTTFTDIKYDLKIDPKRFVFKAPPGVTVMEMPTPPSAAP